MNSTIKTAPGTVKSEGPLLYSPTAIFWFGFLFTTLAGGILLSINLKNQRKQMVIPRVLFFSVLFTLTITTLSFVFPGAQSYGFYIAHFVGAATLSNIYWNKYFFGLKKYKARPIGKALLICLIFALPYAYWIVYNLIHQY